MPWRRTRSGDRQARLVVVGLRERQGHQLPADAHLGDQGPLLAPLQPAAVARGQQRRRRRRRRCGGCPAYSAPGLPRPTTSRSAGVPGARGRGSDLSPVVAALGLRRGLARPRPAAPRPRPRPPRPLGGLGSPRPPRVEGLGLLGRLAHAGRTTTGSSGSTLGRRRPAGSARSPTRMASPMVRSLMSTSMLVGDVARLGRHGEVEELLVDDAALLVDDLVASPSSTIGTSTVTTSSRLTRMKSTCDDVVAHGVALQVLDDGERAARRRPRGRSGR